jgi:hypothetical protein
MSAIYNFGQSFQTKIYYQSKMTDQNYKWLTFWSVIFEWVITILDRSGMQWWDWCLFCTHPVSESRNLFGKPLWQTASYPVPKVGSGSGPAAASPLDSWEYWAARMAVHGKHRGEICWLFNASCPLSAKWGRGWRWCMEQDHLQYCPLTLGHWRVGSNTCRTYVSVTQSGICDPKWDPRGLGLFVSEERYSNHGKLKGLLSTDNT